MDPSDNLYALNEAIRHLQKGYISITFTKWRCAVSYSEEDEIGMTGNPEEYEVGFYYGKNYSRVAIDAFDGLNRHTEYQTNWPGMTFEFDESEAILKITGRSRRTSKDYELIILLQDARKLD